MSNEQWQKVLSGAYYYATKQAEQKEAEPLDIVNRVFASKGVTRQQVDHYDCNIDYKTVISAIVIKCNQLKPLAMDDDAESIEDLLEEIIRLKE